MQYIYDALSNNKLLYQSDADYLESKLRPTIKETIVVEPPKKPTIEIPKITKETVESKPSQKPKGVLPKGWSQNIVSEDVKNITKNIEEEQ